MNIYKIPLSRFRGSLEQGHPPEASAQPGGGQAPVCCRNKGTETPRRAAPAGREMEHPAGAYSCARRGAAPHRYPGKTSEPTPAATLVC